MQHLFILKVALVLNFLIHESKRKTKEYFGDDFFKNVTQGAFNKLGVPSYSTFDPHTKTSIGI